MAQPPTSHCCWLVSSPWNERSVRPAMPVRPHAAPMHAAPMHAAPMAAMHAYSPMPSTQLVPNEYFFGAVKGLGCGSLIFRFLQTITIETKHGDQTKNQHQAIVEQWFTTHLIARTPLLVLFDFGSTAGLAAGISCSSRYANLGRRGRI